MFLPRLKPLKGVAVAAGLITLALTSCDSSFVFEDLRPCIPDYRVRLSYMKNMANEERASRIEAAEAYAFDEDGKLATVSTANLETLQKNDWTLPLNLERYKNYEVIVWGGLVSESPFGLDGTRAVTSKEDLTCRLQTVTDEDANDVSSKKFPGLYHGTTNVQYSVEDGVEERKVPMMKNTNDINVYVRKDTGEPVEEGYYVVELTDANGVMNHYNSVSGSNILYRHHTYTAGDFQIPNGLGGKDETASKAGKWEFSVARLMDNSDARMTIRLGDSNIVLVDEKLIDLIHQAYELINPKSFTEPGQRMDFQEYLDRQDTYDFSYQLRIEEDWIHVSVYVNDWLIIKNDVEWGTK